MEQAGEGCLRNVPQDVWCPKPSPLLCGALFPVHLAPSQLNTFPRVVSASSPRGHLGFGSSFTEIRVTCHTICPFKVYNSMVLSIFTGHHHHQFENIVGTSKRAGDRYCSGKILSGKACPFAKTLALALPSSLTWGELVNLSMPQLAHLKSGDGLDDVILTRRRGMAG